MKQIEVISKVIVNLNDKCNALFEDIHLVADWENIKKVNVPNACIDDCEFYKECEFMSFKLEETRVKQQMLNEQEKAKTKNKKKN